MLVQVWGINMNRDNKVARILESRRCAEDPVYRKAKEDKRIAIAENSIIKVVKRKPVKHNYKPWSGFEKSWNPFADM